MPLQPYMMSRMSEFMNTDEQGLKTDPGDGVATPRPFRRRENSLNKISSAGPWWPPMQG
jgi:hypothetical protein